MPKNLEVAFKSQWDQDAGRSNNDCGPASIAMILNFYGEKLTTDAVHVLTEAGSGLIGFNHLLKAISALGYKGERLARQSPSVIKSYLDMNIPVIVLVKYGSLESVQDKKFKGGHFFVVVGYRDDGYFVNDPNFKDDLRSHGDHHFYTKEEFERAWKDSEKDGNQPNSLIAIQRKVQNNTGENMKTDGEYRGEYWNGLMAIRKELGLQHENLANSDPKVSEIVEKIQSIKKGGTVSGTAPEISGWSNNGLSVEKTSGDLKYRWNYAKKEK